MRALPKSRAIGPVIDFALGGAPFARPSETTVPPIVLVACSATKERVRCPARLLYRSPLFALARQYAERLGGPWFVLSALHGLVEPEAPLDPYNRTLADLDPVGRQSWAHRVALELDRRFPGRGRVVVLAGALYRRDLAPRLEALGFSISVPLEGLGIGQQKKRLKELCQ